MFKKGSFEAANDKVSSIIGKDTHFEGSINADGLVRIDGRAQGSIVNKGDVVIGESGKVVADLKARNITIAGQYEGILEAEGKLDLKKTAVAAGTFKTNGLMIEEGAVISGDLDMQHGKQNKKDKGSPGVENKSSLSETKENKQASAFSQDATTTETTSV